MKEHKSNILHLHGRIIYMDAPIKQKIEFLGLVIIRLYPSDDQLDTYPKESFNRNVYAYDVSGNLVWQIQEAPHGGIDEDKAYMDIRISQDKLVAGNWTGTDYQVNLVDGTVASFDRDVRPW
jgi:hypothetical protein